MLTWERQKELKTPKICFWLFIKIHFCLCLRHLPKSTHYLYEIVLFFKDSYFEKLHLKEVHLSFNDNMVSF